MISKTEIKRLRILAKEVKEYSKDLEMQKKASSWTGHNDLKDSKPMLLVSPEGAWKELIPGNQLICEGNKAREIEWKLLSLIFRYKYLKDDFVITNDWIVNKQISDTGWGLIPEFVSEMEDPEAAWDYDGILGYLPKVWDKSIKHSGNSIGFEPVIRTSADLKKFKYPVVLFDEKRTQSEFDETQAIFGDILNVKLKGKTRISFHPMGYYSRLRGHENVFIDMYDEPDMVHEAMSIYEEGYKQLIQQYEKYNLLDLNNDATYNSSGGFGFTTELPKSGFNPDRIRPCDMWTSAESQEFASVSPQMHEEFVRQYERRLLEPFGLSGYGCCDPMDQKLNDVFKISNLRRISISPFSDIEVCASQIRNRYIFSWKPNPSILVGDFSTEVVTSYIQKTIDISKKYNCILEIILKDTSTCENHPERFTQFIEISKKLISENWD